MNGIVSGVRVERHDHGTPSILRLVTPASYLGPDGTDAIREKDLIAQHKINVARTLVVVADAYLRRHRYVQAESAWLKAERYYEAAESDLAGQYMEDLVDLRINLERIKSAILQQAPD